MRLVDETFDLETCRRAPFGLNSGSKTIRVAQSRKAALKGTGKDDAKMIARNLCLSEQSVDLSAPRTTMSAFDGSRHRDPSSPVQIGWLIIEGPFRSVLRVHQCFLQLLRFQKSPSGCSSPAVLILSCNSLVFSSMARSMYERAASFASGSMATGTALALDFSKFPS